MCQICVSWLYRLETEFKEAERPQEAHLQFLIWDEVCFFKLLFIYLSVAVLGLCCCMSFSLVEEVGATIQLWYTGFSSQWFLLLWRTGSRVHGLPQLWHVGSLVAAAPRLESTGSLIVAHGLSCSVACGIFLDQGLKLCLLPLAGQFFTTEHHQGSPERRF